MTIGGRIPDVLTEIKICERFGWTLEELYAHPEDFIEAIVYMIGKENEIKNKIIENYGK